MASCWRSYTFVAGLLLFLLGISNWLVSRDKIDEFVHRALSQQPTPQSARIEDFPELTHRTNATLLARLHRGIGEYSFLDAKTDFYEIAESGGRAFALLGVLLMGLHLWRRGVLHRAPRQIGEEATPPTPDSTGSD